jgi:FixJ family two-component response regulator
MHKYAERQPLDAGDIPTVFIVDTDSSVRESLELLIRCAGWRPRVAGSAEEFLAHPRVMTPCCLLTELRLGELSGLELQKLIAHRAELAVIFMAEHADVNAAVQAMKAGALEILTKPLVADLLLAAIRSAIETSRVTLNRAAQNRALQERFACLSPREREVTNLVVSGRLNKQVAGELGITERTVKAHRGRMMRKMRARSFAELVTMVDSLRRLTTAAAGNLHLHNEQKVGNNILAESLRLDSSAFVSI